MTTRIAVLDRDLCIREKCGYVCEKVCPPNRMGEECIIIEEDSRFPVISEQLCIGCGLCVKKCPVYCIDIINLPHELDKPIFQYGINTFRIYGLPLPKAGAAALIGKNGIGKTTAMNVLSRKLVPNFADFNSKLTEEQILEKLNIEEKRYFSQLGKEIKISHKPQYIDRIRDVFKGTVRKLLEEASKGKDISEIVELFSIKTILSRKISQLSGGELQKVALATATLKDADIYYFDEFTNYLDIAERLKVAIILRDLADKKKVMLADHDLTVLDYVSSYVYIFYGEENDYGVVSGIKNVRTGINEYIAGFLKDENLRFRPYELTFSSHSEGEIKSPTILKYEDMGKSFDGFSFSSSGGELRKGEIIGMVGQNALGKSLFIKMLAGIEKPDKGKPTKLKVAYKPQYITAGNVPVKDMFSSKNLNKVVFEECKRRLKLSSLMEKKLTEISGGELQRVAITLTLSMEADIYLFDEPSAFLDIEQRFEFAHLLRGIISESKKSAFVVDHDIVFIDSISNRLMVFEGESSVKGRVGPPLNKREGMNKFLSMISITMRRDKDSKRPRVNKPDSSLDREQKENGSYYYSL